MKNISRYLFLLCAATALSSAANAEGGGRMREACKEDAKSFCSDTQPGGGRILRCLHDHDDQISDSCHDALQKIGRHRDNQGDGNAPQDEGDNGRGPALGGGRNDGSPPHDDNGNDRPPPPPPRGDNSNDDRPSPPEGNDNGQPPAPPQRGDSGNDRPPPPPPGGGNGGQPPGGQEN